MAAPKNNKFWQKRTTHGREKIFEDPNSFWLAACEYFDYCEENPLEEEVAFHYQGMITTHKLNKMRAMTISGLCIFLDIDQRTFNNYGDGNKDAYKDFFPIVTRIREIIATQKFEGSAAGLLNANIIARDLGLTDKKDITFNEPVFNIENVGQEKLNDVLPDLNE
jgi:hypothetical protein